MFDRLHAYLGRQDDVTPQTQQEALAAAEADHAEREQRLKEAVMEAWRGGRDDLLATYAGQPPEYRQDMAARFTPFEQRMSAALGYEAPAPQEPEPPAKSALKAEWVAHAQAQGDPDAEDKTKAELIEEHGPEAETPDSTAG